MLFSVNTFHYPYHQSNLLALSKTYLNYALLENQILQPAKNTYFYLNSVDLKAWWFLCYLSCMFGKHIAYLRQHISNSNCVKQPLLVNKNMENNSSDFLLYLMITWIQEKHGRLGTCVRSQLWKLWKIALSGLCCVKLH